MSKLKVKLNRAGVAALLKSGEMEGMLREQAETIVKRCGEGYASDTRQMPTRVIASVYTETEAAALDNLENNTILQALGGKAVIVTAYEGGHTVKAHKRTLKDGRVIWVKSHNRGGQTITYNRNEGRGVK